ncbi:MAG: DUF192 domain-containing protein [Candidatus Omnitrophica bacterium]|nr:DUF192 domain-containing protein [Candidatus Omnitrophota bacterium]
MKIINKTKNSILAKDVVVADTLLKRIKGLLGRKEFKQPEALIIKPCNSIHTFFMRFPIDVLFVDKNHKVIAAISGLKPFRLSRVYFSSHYVVELPAGTLESSATSKGDRLKIEGGRFSALQLSEK